MTRARIRAPGSVSGRCGVRNNPSDCHELSTRKHSTRPEYLDWTQAQKTQAALPVLRSAFEKLASGWCPPLMLADLGNTPAPDGWGLTDAVQSSSQMQPGGVGVDCWYARTFLRRLEWELTRWERHPLRTQEDVLRLVARAIELAGGEPPAIRIHKPARHCGGWRISHGEP